ncbi:Ig-like domain-containing protein [Treponema sp.]|uniref:Ig-like domain-containing protein n=1 Tax=Treponema sp. TaxID=166 RepID=UPI00257A844E|nr:Ig-like domain-containing protein [Treponema sp.]MBE6355022.1 hypothetical protein [Treponema sp.]
MRNIKFSIILASTIFLNSCSQFLIPELKIESYEYDTQKITIKFSSKPNPTSVHKSFNLKEDKDSINGVFEFNNNAVYYYPDNGIKNNYDYELSISTSCETDTGISIANTFIWNFSTRTETTPPYITNISPSDEQEISNTLQSIRIDFSETIDESSFEKAFSITPSIEYILEYSEDKNWVKIIPLEEFSKNKDYKIKISTDLMDQSRNKMLNDFNSIFSLQKDYLPPQITSYIYNLNDFRTDIASQNTIDSLPTDSILRLNFSKPMNFTSINSMVSFNQNISYTIKKDELESKWFEIKFNSLKWNSSCTFSLSKDLTDEYLNKIENEISYTLIFNNESCRPPEFLKAYLQTGDWKNNAVTAESYQTINAETNFHYLVLDPNIFKAASDVKTEMYLIFTSSKAEANSGINLFSFMDKFSISCTNSCLNIIIKKLQIDNEALSKYPLNQIINNDPLTSDLNITVIHCDLEITNTANNGIIQFNIEPGFMDSLGNKSVTNYSYKYNK